MKITILCSDILHPVFSYLTRWRDLQTAHFVTIISDASEAVGPGDILFLVSCSEMVKKHVRDKFRHTLVLHAGDLPKGRGWSPHIWEILNGSNELTLSLLSAEDGVDRGPIWKKIKIQLNGYELYSEINHKLFEAELKMLDYACENIDLSKPKEQLEVDATYYKKRVAGDSELDINKSIKSQFNLLRVCDQKRFPAFINIDGHKYNVHITRDSGE